MASTKSKIKKLPKIKSKAIPHAGPFLDKNTKIQSYTPWVIYENLQIFCEGYKNYTITSDILKPDIFIKDLQFDGYIKINAQSEEIKLADKEPKKSEKWSIYIGSSNMKIFFDLLCKDMSNSIVIYEDSLEKNINRVITKVEKLQTDKSRVIRTFRYTIFKIILPKLPGAPKYRVLPPSEVTEICNYHRCTPIQFNKLLYTDPMAIWYDIRPGDLVEVTKISEVTGESLGYRYCIN